MKEFVTEKNTGMGVHYATKDAIIRTLCKNGEFTQATKKDMVSKGLDPESHADIATYLNSFTEG